MKLSERFGLATIVLSALAISSPAIADDADSVVVYAKHSPDKPGDPVGVKFERFKVVKASFDPKKIEGGKATIELDTTSLKSGSDKRDAHLQTPEFIDAKKFAAITVDIDKVKSKASKTYTAEATVKFRDITKTYPVTFDVVDQKADAIRIKSEAAFSRYDFNVGSKDLTKIPVNPELVIKLELWLKSK